jgi:quinol monooxygenase YgiN
VPPPTVIDKLITRGGSEEQPYEGLRNLVAPTRGEEGCISYDLLRSVEDPGTFMSYENRESRQLWEEHIESPHLDEFSGKQEELTGTRELFVGEKD